MHLYYYICYIYTSVAGSLRRGLISNACWFRFVGGGLEFRIFTESCFHVFSRKSRHKKAKKINTAKKQGVIEKLPLFVFKRCNVLELLGDWDFQVDHAGSQEIKNSSYLRVFVEIELCTKRLTALRSLTGTT